MCYHMLFLAEKDEIIMLLYTQIIWCRVWFFWQDNPYLWNCCSNNCQLHHTYFNIVRLFSIQAVGLLLLAAGWVFGWLEHNPELDKWENVDDILFLFTGYFKYVFNDLSFSAEIFLAYYLLSSRQDICCERGSSTLPCKSNVSICIFILNF